MGRTVRAVAAVAMMVVLSTGEAFAATLGGPAAGDAIRGANGADTIRGGGGGDILRGLDGDDRLYGDGGSDNLYSGPGNDFIPSAGTGAGDHVACGDGHATVQKGSDPNLDRFVGCEKLVG